MDEKLKMAMIAINKWMYFGWNYSNMEYKGMFIPQFLVETKWTCNREHMIEKWKNATRSDSPNEYLTKFYAELDMGNRQALIEWVMENYNNEIKIIQE